MNAELSAALQGVLIAALTAIGAAVAALGTYGTVYIKKLLEVRTAELEKSRADQLKTAGETAALAAEEASRSLPMGGADKAAMAQRIAVGLMSLPPDVTSPHDERVADVVRAGVQKMRRSMPHPTTYGFTASELGTLVKHASQPPPAVLKGEERLPPLSDPARITEGRGLPPIIRKS